MFLLTQLSDADTRVRCGVQPRFRSMWERYCRGVQAIVFVVDSADLEGLEQARKELHGLLSKPSLAGIPLLVLGNKDDLPQSLATNELIDRLELKVCLSPQAAGVSFIHTPLLMHLLSPLRMYSIQIHMLYPRFEVISTRVVVWQHVDLARSRYVSTIARCILSDSEDMSSICVQGLRDREVAVYSISCKSQNNIDITIAWLTAHSK